MSIYVYYGILAGSWLVSLVAGALPIRWSFWPVRGRFLPAVVLSFLALAIGYLGTTRFYTVTTTTVNGQLKWPAVSEGEVSFAQTQAVAFSAGRSPAVLVTRPPGI